MKSSILRVALILALTGCATHQDVLDSGVYSTFTSSQTAATLAKCISRNSDDYFFHNMVSQVLFTGTEPIDVEMRNGGSQYATIKVSTAPTGSTADFYFSTLGRFNDPAGVTKILTKGCN